MVCHIDKNGNVVTISAKDAIPEKRKVLDPTQYKKNSRVKRIRKARREYSQCENDHFQCCVISEEDQKALYEQYELALEEGPQTGELFTRGFTRIPSISLPKLFHTHIGPRLLPLTTQKCSYCSCQESLDPSLDQVFEEPPGHLFKPGKCPHYKKGMLQAAEFWGTEMIQDKEVLYFLRTRNGFPCQVCHELFANTFNLRTHGHAMNV